MSNSSERRIQKARVVYREGGDDLNSYRQQRLEEYLQRPRRETVFEQAERERAEQQAAS